MGLDVLGQNESVEAEGWTEQAELIIGRNSSNQACVGMARQQDGNFSVIGDFYYAKSAEARKYYNKTKLFQDNLSRFYCVEKATQDLAEQGFTMEENPNGDLNAQGMVQMVACRY